MDRSGPALRSSKRCAAPASMGRVGIWMLAVCVDCMVAPLGTCTCTVDSGVVGFLLTQGVLFGK